MEDETVLTLEEVTQLLRIVQNENANLLERVVLLEKHVHKTPELLEPTSWPVVVTVSPPTTLGTTPTSPLPRRTRPT